MGKIWLNYRRWRGEKALGKFIGIYPRDEIPDALLIEMLKFFRAKMEELQK